MPLALDREDMFDLMMKAHEQDVTLNEMVESLLLDVLEIDKNT